MEEKNDSPPYITVSLGPHGRNNIFEYIQNGVMVTNCQSEIIYVNPAFTRITGYTAEEAIGQNPGMLHSGRHDKSFYEELWGAIKSKGFWEGEIWNRRKSGTIFPEYLTISSLVVETSDACNYIAVFSDITYLKIDIYHKLKLAFYDPLTALPNRSLYKDRVNLAIKAGQTNPGLKHAILFMDLDKFKHVNDTYGHLVGDHLLKMVAQRLSSIVRAGDTVARVGGDEFTAILTDVKDKEFAEKLARRMVDSIEQPFSIDGHQINISISIGISFFPSDAHKLDDLLAGADEAMYRAKKNQTRICIK